MPELNFSLRDIRQPFRLDLTAWALRRRPVNEIDRWDGETYSRVLEIDQAPVLIKIVQSGGRSSPRLHVQAISDGKTRDLKSDVTSFVEKMLGLRVDLRPFYKLASEDKRLSLLSTRFMGLKPPLFPSVFEALTNGIACQQLSLHVGLILLNRLASHCGLEVSDSKMHSFPTANCLAKFAVGEYRKLGFSRSKALAIRNLAGALLNGSIKQDLLMDAEDERVVTELEQLKGVGRWTAEYALLRGLGRVRIFPGDDVGARSRLKKWLGLRKDLDYERVNKVVSRFRPYGGLIYFHLLLDGLEKAGDLAG